MIQLPCNLFDNRSDYYANFFKKNNIQVHARSIFLQGLLLTKSKEIINRFNKYKNFFNKLSILEKKNHIPLYNLCISHVIAKSYVNKIVFGVANLKQLKKILNCKIRNLNTKIQFPEIKKINLLIDPRKW